MKLKFFFTGRLGRRDFFLATVLKVLLFIIYLVGLNFLSEKTGWSDAVLWQVLVADFFILILWIFGFSISIRRCYDLNWNKPVSILLSLLLGFPYIFGGVFLIFLAFAKGTSGPNKYGDPNLGSFSKTVFGIK